MKKAVVSFLVGVMLLQAVACGNSASSVESTENGGTETTVAGFDGEYRWPTISELVPDDSRKSTANTDERYESVTVAISNIPSDLSPYTMSNSITNMEIFDTLLEQTSATEFVGRLAESWEEVDDTHFDITIYDYIFDSDGNHLTADDVVFSFKTFQESGFARDFNYLENVEAVDEYTVEFTWKEPLESLTAFASMMTKTYIVTEQAYNEHDFVTDPVGTGPYKLVSYTTSSSAVLEARDDYWQTDETLVAPNAARNVQRIEYDFISDGSMAAVAFENGDTANVTLNADNLSLFDEGGEYADLGQLVCYPDTVSISILPNMDESSIMSDLNMRLAVFYALDSSAFAEALGSDLFYPVYTEAAPSIADYSDTWEDMENYQNVYDADLALEYLSKTDYGDETLTIMYEGNSEKETIAQIMQAYLESVGIKSELVAWDHDLIAAHASDASQWDLFLASSGDADYTANRIRKVYGADAGYTQGALNISLDADDTFQDMINSINTVSGNSESATKEVLDYIYDQALGMGTAYQVNIACYSKDIAQIRNKYSASEVIYGACEYYLD